MIVLRTPAPLETTGDAGFYRRMATEGVAHASAMNGERYGVSAAFDPADGVPILSWCVGGAETYQLACGRTIVLRPGGVLTLRDGERYAYAADRERRMRARTLAFPLAMTREARSADIDDAAPEPADDAPVFETRVFHPSPRLAARLDGVARAIERGETDDAEISDAVALVFDDVLDEQRADRDKMLRLEVAKPATRVELARRVRRAIEQIHADYPRSDLDVGELARTACLSRHHFIRCFTALEGRPPSRYIAAVRMHAAAGLLETFDMTVSDVAAAVGYADRSAFQRRFRATFGQTPNDRRSRARA